MNVRINFLWKTIPFIKKRFKYQAQVSIFSNHTAPLNTTNLFSTNQKRTGTQKNDQDRNQHSWVRTNRTQPIEKLVSTQRGIKLSVKLDQFRNNSIELDHNVITI